MIMIKIIIIIIIIIIMVIDKEIVKDCKRWLTSLAVAWIDYRKAYDVVPHSWIQK